MLCCLECCVLFRTLAWCAIALTVSVLFVVVVAFLKRKCCFVSNVSILTFSVVLL